MVPWTNNQNYLPCLFSNINWVFKYKLGKKNGIIVILVVYNSIVLLLGLELGGSVSRKCSIQARPRVCYCVIVQKVFEFLIHLWNMNTLLYNSVNCLATINVFIVQQLILDIIWINTISQYGCVLAHPSLTNDDGLNSSEAVIFSCIKPPNCIGSINTGFICFGFNSHSCDVWDIKPSSSLFTMQVYTAIVELCHSSHN